MVFDKKAWSMAYRQTAKEKARRKAYKQATKYKAYWKGYLTAYQKTERGREAIKKAQSKFRKTNKCKDYQRQYHREYFKTPKGKAIMSVVLGKRRTATKSGDLTPEQWLGIRYQSPICPMCGRFVECENLSLDHIIPLSRCGLHSKGNVQALCRSCNSRKGARR